MTAPLTPPPAAALGAGRVGTMVVRNGRYADGTTTYQRTSNMLKLIETDTYHLDEWKANMLAVGLASRPDLVLGVAAAAQYDPATGKLTREAKSTLRGLRRQAEDAARSKAGSNRGTAVHTATERLDLGESVESIGLPAPFDADLQAYAALKQALGLTYHPEHIERSVRNLKTVSVGTIDRLASSALLVELGLLAPGELIVTDVKTESDPLANLIHIAPQLANYANAEDVWVPEPRPATDDDPNGPLAGRYEPMPAVSKTVGLMIHVRDGRAVPYFIDLTAGWESAQAAAAQRERIRASKVGLGEPGCWAMLVPVELPQPSAPAPATAPMPIVAAAAARGPMGFSAPAGMTPAEYVATANVPREVIAEQAVRGDDGLVRWAPVVDEHPLVPSLVEQVWLAPDLARLAELFELAQQHGVPWSGRVADMAEQRRRIIECPQRALHKGSGLCACGWSGEDNDVP